MRLKLSFPRLSDEAYLATASLLFYGSLFFNLNNKTLLGIFAVFFFVFYRRFKSLFKSLLILYFLFLPFEKGKTWEVVLIPEWILRAEIPYSFKFNISFSDVAFAGMLLLFIYDKWKGRNEFQKISLRKTDLYLLGFLFFSSVSVYFSHAPIVSSLAYIRLLQMALLFLFFRTVFINSIYAKYLSLTLAASLIFQGFWSSIQFLLGKPLGKAIEPVDLLISSSGYFAAEDKSFFRPQGTWEHPNTLGAFSLMIILYVLFQLLNNQAPKWQQRYFLISASVGFVGLVFSASRASWLIFGLMLAMAVVYLRKQKVKISFSIPAQLRVSAIIFAIIVLPILVLPRLSHLYTTLANQGGAYYRAYLLEKAWFLSLEAPMGIGLATFPAVLVEQYGFFAWPAPVHNLFLEIMVEAGVFSLCFFLIFLILTYKRYFVRLEFFKKHQFYVKSGALFASLGFLVIAQFYPFFNSSSLMEYFWVFLGLAACDIL